MARFDEDTVREMVAAYLRPPVVLNLATMKFHGTSAQARTSPGRH